MNAAVTPHLNKFEIGKAREAQSYLQEALHEPILLHEVASRFGLSAPKLNAAFVYLFGESFTNFLRKSRMETADLLLRETDKPIKEIAGLIGFKSSKNFMTAYRKYYGRTAGSVRKNDSEY